MYSCPHKSSQWETEGLLGSFPSGSLELLSPSSRTVFHSLWGMKWADHHPLDLSYSLSFSLAHTLKPSRLKPAQRAAFTPRRFLLSMEYVDPNWRLFNLDLVTSVRSIYWTIVIFFLSLVQSKVNPHRLSPEIYFMKV